MKIYWTTVQKVIDEAPDTKTYMLDCPEDFVWEPGTHAHLGLEDFNVGEKPNKGLVRHMSITTLPSEEVVGFTTRIRNPKTEYKERLEELTVGSRLALFKLFTNFPLKREGKSLYFLSQGVAIASYRPLLLDYLENQEGVESIYSLNIDATEHYLFTDLFQTDPENKIRAEYVDSRDTYYQRLDQLAQDKDGLFYLVGDDHFIAENIQALRDKGLSDDQIILDKHDFQREAFFA